MSHIASPVICWRRGSGLKRPSGRGGAGRSDGLGGLVCLWHRGFIANRNELERLCGGSRDWSDRRLLLEACLRLGDEAPARVSGPLSWIVWDDRRRRLLAVAERTGNTRLYYSVDRTHLAIDWRPEILAAATPSSLRPDEPSMVAHLCARANPSSRSFYSGVAALAPGQFLEASDETLAVRDYWQLDSGPTLRLESDAEYAEALRSLLFEVAADYLPGRRAAITLSGGLDSTSTAAALRRSCGAQDLAALRWVAPTLRAADEDALSLAAARRLGLEDVSIRADRFWPLSTPEGIRTLPNSPLYNFFADVWDATYEAARELEVRHVFTGLSGDHLFGGMVYSYPDLLLTGRWLRLGRELREHRPYSRMGMWGVARGMIVSPIVSSVLPNRARTRASPAPWLAQEKREVFLGLLGAPEPRRWALPGKRLRLAQLRDPLLPQLVEMGGRQAARHGLELRHPLLDHRLLEFAATLPTDQTFRAAVRKIILRNAMSGTLPDEVLTRREKIYPTAIANLGLRRKETEKVWSLLTDMRCADLGLVDQNTLRENYQSFLDGRHNSTLFWNAISLEDWLRRYF